MCGLGARRTCEELVRRGAVSINGEVVNELWRRIGEGDKVTIDGKTINPKADYRYYAFNKPVGVLTTTKDPRGRRTIYESLPPWMRTLKPIGRLDRDTEGLLLLTDDGAFAQKVAHPGGGINKRYYVLARGEIAKSGLRRLEKGVKLKDGHIGKCDLVSVTIDEDNTEVVLDVGYGRKRMIRQMFAAISHKIITLRRIEVGPVKLDDLASGEYRGLTDGEIEAVWSEENGR
ncbi:MAG: rRNA pseudouridine synthase [bacterium]|nr:rRNA pseudouridine synthase [bacterium]